MGLLIVFAPSYRAGQTWRRARACQTKRTIIVASETSDRLFCFSATHGEDVAVHFLPGFTQHTEAIERLQNDLLPTVPILRFWSGD